MTVEKTPATLNAAFRSYQTPSLDDMNRAWVEGYFVLDANMLLNFYRYSTATRDRLFKILDTLKPRIWVPHHAALEFERRRRSIIAEQKSMFSKVRGIVASNIKALENGIVSLNLERRHSTIDPKRFLKSIDDAKENFLSALSKLELAQPDVYQEDAIHIKLNDLLDGCIGPPYSSQDEIDKIVKDYDYRLVNRIPPGFQDAVKSKADEPKFSFSEIIYPAEIGDLIIWKQIKEFSRTNSVKSLIFVTDDRKEDWWYIIDSLGEKTIGPRPELVEEIANYCPGIFFWMYTPERFAERGGIHLKLAADDKAVQEIKTVSSALPHRIANSMRGFVAENAALDWIHKYRGPIVSNEVHVARGGTIDAIYQSNSRGVRVGVEVKMVVDESKLIRIFHEALVSFGRVSDKRNDIDEYLLIIVSDRSKIVQLFGQYVESFFQILIDHWRLSRAF